jgi:hypothetical protein
VRVKTFVRRSAGDLDEAINRFVADKNVIDIRLCQVSAAIPGAVQCCDMWFSALVLYSPEAE